MGQLLADNVPGPWMWIRATGAFEGTSTFIESVYQPPDQSKKPEPLIIEDAATDWALADCYRQLARLLTSDKVGPFSKCHYFLENNGKYRADYEY
jgi:hypothetical protein